MNPFRYEQAETQERALSLGAKTESRYLAGGTNLMDLMKEGLTSPQVLVDVSELSPDISELPNGGLRLGAAVKNAETANHPVVRERFPLLSKAILAGASYQIRNMASNGGNLLQRTRCPYFYESASPCNKRKPGSGCPAFDGNNHNHAIFGWTPDCVATYPGDMANALVCLEAIIVVRSTDHAERRIPAEDFHRLPDETPQRDNTLKPGDLIVAIELPPSGLNQHYEYIKVRERSSYAFALVAAAVGIELGDKGIAKARITLGGVAHKPWRAKRAEEHLQNSPLNRAQIAKASEIAFAEASPLQHNAFKVQLGIQALTRALENAIGDKILGGVS